jgi:hypothetical protein
MRVHKEVAELLKQVKRMADTFHALPWGDLSEDEFNIVRPLGIGMLKSWHAVADIELRKLREQRSA